MVFRLLNISDTPDAIISIPPRIVKMRVPGPPVFGSATPGVFFTVMVYTLSFTLIDA